MIDIRYDGILEFEINNIGYVSVLRNENYIFEYKAGKERYSFIYVKNGAVKYYFYREKQMIIAKKGAFLFIPKHLPYKATYLEDNTILKIMVFDISAKEALPYIASPFSIYDIDITQVFHSISSQNVYNTFYLTAKIYEIFSCIQRKSVVTPPKYKKILPALYEIQQKYADNNKVSYYANMCNMSEQNFRKLFKEYTGSSIIEYRNMIRIAEIRKMIDSGEFSIGEAAYHAGFNNMSFFYEVYNRFREKV